MLAHLTYFDDSDYVSNFINMTRNIWFFTFVKRLKDYSPGIFSPLDIYCKITF